MFSNPEPKDFCILTSLASLATLGSETSVELQQQGKHRQARECSMGTGRAFQLALGGPGAFLWLGVGSTPFSPSYSCVGLAHILIQCLSLFINFHCRPGVCFHLSVAGRGSVELFQMQRLLLESDSPPSHGSVRQRQQFEFWASNQIFKKGTLPFESYRVNRTQPGKQMYF